MFQPQPTPYSPFSYGLNLSPPQPQPSQPQPPPTTTTTSLPLGFNTFNPIPLQQHLPHPHPHSHSNLNANAHSHPLSHPNSHSHHSHQHQHANSLSPHSQSSNLRHSPPANNNSSIIISNQNNRQNTIAGGRGLGNTLNHFQERHPHSHQSIFSPINNHTSSGNGNGSSNLNLPHSTNVNSLPPPFSQHNQQQYKMSSNEVNDMEAQEALARDFQPNLEGPLVGEKKSSLVITEEYAKADPIYIAKTTALPQKYSHYRPILGDGNCGWRAAGFSYFETLLKMRNKSQVEEEMARMMSLNNLLSTVGGFDSWLFEDMVEETTNLLKDIADLMDESIQAAETLILQRFNSSEHSNAIVYHFRLLASSWLKANPDNYEGFIPDGGGVDQYRKDWLEPTNTEIDHLGMTLLIDVLLKPIGFAVEIVYLDRSEGTQVNSHIMQAEDPSGQPTNPGGPIIHLLYRPSHYDILYKDAFSLRQAIEANSNIQVNRATNFSQQHQIQQAATMNNFQSLDLTLLNLPGFTLAAPQHGFASQYQTPMSQPFASAPLSTSVSPISPTGNSISSPQSATSVLPPRSTFTSINSPTSLASPILNSPHPFQSGPTTLPIHTLPPPNSLSHILPQLSSGSIPVPSFRPSKWEWARAADLQEGPMPTFQTSTFKNSHYNTAHYNNPNFQPEEWSPDDEGLGSKGSSGPGGGGGTGFGGWGRKRSSG